MTPALLAVLVAFALRLVWLETPQLNGDEAFAVLFARQPVADLVAHLRAQEAHPPGYYLSLKAWMLVAGDGELVVRYLSTVAGVLAVPAGIALGRRLLGSRAAALAAGLLVALNPFLIEHGQQARMYALLASFSLIYLLASYRAWDSASAARQFVLFASSVLVLASHYFAVIGVLMGMLLVAAIRRRRPSRSWVLAQGAAWLAFAVWAALALGLLQGHRLNWPTPLGLPTMAFATVRAHLLGLSPGVPSPDVPGATLLTWGSLLLAAASLAYAARRRPVGLPLALYPIAGLAALWLASLRSPLFHPRFVIFIVPVLCLGWAAALDGRALGGGLVAAGIVLFAGADVAYFARRLEPPAIDWRAQARLLQERARPGDVIAQNFPDPTLAYYLGGSPPSLVLPPEAGLPPAQEAMAVLRELAGYERVWFMPYAHPLWDPDGGALRVLTSFGAPRQRLEGESLKVLLFLTPRGRLSQVQKAGVTAGDFGRLRGYELVEEGPAGAQLVLYWEAMGPAPHDYQVFVHVLDARGEILTQADGPPFRGLAPTSLWSPGTIIPDPHRLTIPGGISPKAVLVGLYRLDTGERVPLREGGKRLRHDAYSIPWSGAS